MAPGLDYETKVQMTGPIGAGMADPNVAKAYGVAPKLVWKAHEAYQERGTLARAPGRGPTSQQQ